MAYIEFEGTVVRTIPRFMEDCLHLGLDEADVAGIVALYYRDPFRGRIDEAGDPDGEGKGDRVAGWRGYVVRSRISEASEPLIVRLRSIGRPGKPRPIVGKAAETAARALSGPLISALVRKLITGG